MPFLDYRLGRGSRKMPDYASISGTLLVASRILQGISGVCEMCDLDGILAKYGKMEQVIAGC